MNRIPVRSRNLRSVGYDPGTLTLEIEFSTRAIFRYAGVPSMAHAGLMAAQSVDSFFYNNIRDKYPVSKVPIEVLRKDQQNMAVTDGANRNPNAASAGQPSGTLEAGTQAALRNKGGVAGGGDAPAGPSKTGPQDVGTAAAMKAQNRQ